MLVNLDFSNTEMFFNTKLTAIENPDSVLFHFNMFVYCTSLSGPHNSGTQQYDPRCKSWIKKMTFKTRWRNPSCPLDVAMSNYVISLEVFQKHSVFFKIDTITILFWAVLPTLFVFYRIESMFAAHLWLVTHLITVLQNPVSSHFVSVFSE